MVTPDDPAAAPTDDAPAGRAALWAEVEARPPATLRPASITGREALRPLPGDLLATLDVRRRAGLQPTGTDHPRRRRAFPTVVVPTALTVAALVVAVVAGGALALVATVVTVLSAVTAGSSYIWIRRDPLRITAAQRQAVSGARRWQSRQQWSDELLGTPERALVDVAADLVQQIATDPAWASGYLDGHRLTLDLAGELDGIDAQANELARARLAGGAEADVATSRAAILDRVLALRRYRRGLAGLSASITSADTQAHAAPAIGSLRSTVDENHLAVRGIDRLTDELGVLTRAVDTTAAETRRDDPRP